MLFSEQEIYMGSLDHHSRLHNMDLQQEIWPLLGVSSPDNRSVRLELELRLLPCTRRGTSSVPALVEHSLCQVHRRHVEQKGLLHAREGRHGDGTVSRGGCPRRHTSVVSGLLLHRHQVSPEAVQHIAVSRPPAPFKHNVELDSYRKPRQLRALI